MNWQNLLHNPQIVVIILALGISGINWIIRQAKNQSEQRRVQDLRNRQAAEALRTGKPLPPTPAPMAPRPAPLRSAPSLAEAARLRQAAQQSLEQERRERLRQLRAQADARSSPAPLVPAPSPFEAAPRPAPATTPAAPIRRELWPGGPVVLINPPAAKPAPRAAPQQAPASRKTSAKPVRQQPQRRDAVSPTSRALRMPAQQKITSTMPTPAAPQADLSRAPRMSQPRAEAAPRPALVLIPTDWRRALIASEILAHPLALRDPATLAGAPHY